MGTFDRHLEVDLSKQTFKTGTIERERLQKYVGGKGVGLSLLVEQDTSANPFDPGNPLIFVTGPLTGSAIQTSARSALVTRSPLTGGFLDSHCGGHFGPALRRSGWDYLSLGGKAEAPVYLHVTPEGAEFHPAEKLWGEDAFETERTLRDRHPRSRVACIGQAGENLVRFAAIGTEYNRHFGRGGSGAVMGSKNLKAVVVSGNERVEHFDDDEFKKLARQLTADLKEHPGAQKRFKLGTMMWIRMGQEVGRFLPTRNFQMGQFEHYEKLTSETMNRELDWSHVGCYGCGVIRCSKVSKWEGKQMEGPEYESTAYLGSNCELESAREVAQANWLCDRYGMDTISTGVTISFAMECAERGLLSEADNQRIRFGSADSSHRLIQDIALRRGIGDVLAEGTRRAAAAIGKASDYFAIQIAGMELSGVNPLGSYSMALALATSDFASHTRMWSATDEMYGKLEVAKLPPYIKAGQDEINARNCLIICDVLPFGFDRLVPFVNASTGFSYTPEDMMETGERIATLARMYNLHCGRTRADDTLPPRFFEEPSCAGLMEGRKIPRELFHRQVEDIFALRGWDGQGRPASMTLERLGIDWPQ